jgi:pimeloyl-ACP methyl ester carboxylesterase
MNEHSARYVQIGELRLHVRGWGKRGSSIVLLHGLASTSHIWDFVAPKLAKHFSVYALEQRGHGLSDKPLTGYGFAQMSADLEQLLGALALDRILLVGHSWGADVALDFAARFPERVASLCLLDGGLIDFQAHQSWPETEILLAPPRLEHMSPRELAEAFPQWFGAAWQPDFLPIVLASFETSRDKIAPRLGRAQHMEIVRALWEQRPYEVYSHLRCPTKTLLAIPPKPHNTYTESLVAWRKEGLELARQRIEKFEAVILEDAIHDIPLQHPERIVEEIEKLSKQ